MVRTIRRGLELVLRSAATPLFLGMRWAQRQPAAASKDFPAPSWDLRLASKAALDELFVAAELATATFVSLREHRRLASELRRALALYEARGWLKRPERYHRAPAPLEPARLRETRSRGMVYHHLEFESGYEPHAGEPGRERWLGYKANRTGHAWLLQHPGGPRPWCICIPGYRMGRPLVDFTGFRARWLHRELGLNVAFSVLPLHGPRRIGWRGGDGFLSGDFMDTIHAQTQAVWDVRRLTSWLWAQGAPAVAVHGVSLGGCTAALLASLEKRIDCVIAGIPAADLTRLIRAHVPDLVVRAARRRGLSFERIQRALRVVSPLAMRRLVPRERCYVYAGVADRLASPDQARDLWHHWGRPRATWYQGSHISFMWEEDVKRLVGEALACRGLIPERSAR